MAVIIVSAQALTILGLTSEETINYSAIVYTLTQGSFVYILVLLARILKERVFALYSPLFMLEKVFQYIILFHVTANKFTDDEAQSYDLKRLAEKPLIHFLFLILFAPMSPKVDFFTTIPITLVINIVFIRASFVIEDDNMACFTAPSNFVRHKLVDYTTMIMLSSMAWFLGQKHKVNSFLQKRRAEFQ